MRIALAMLACAAMTKAQAPATVAGRVTDESGQPLKKATVQLIENVLPRESIRTTYTASTGVDGSFLFDNLNPARYQITVERAGYLSSAVTIAGPGYEGSLLTAGAGAHLMGFSIKMPREARIAGKITDEDGDPLPDANIALLRWHTINGTRTLNGFASGIAAADGSFVIGGLRPGHFYVSASAGVSRTGPPMGKPEGKGPHAIYIATYYPGAADPLSAAPITVSAGQDLRGVNIQVQKATGFRIRGKVVDISGAPVNMASLQLAPEKPIRDGEFHSTRSEPDGSFEFDPVLPGAYILRSTPPTQTAPAPSGRSRVEPEPPRLFGSQRVIVTRDGAEDVKLALSPGLEIRGKLTVERTSAAPPFRDHVGRVVSLRSAGGVRQTPIHDDGTFVMADVDPNLYSPVGVFGLPEGFYVKALRYGDRETAGQVLDLTSQQSNGLNVGDLNIIASPHAASISGTVRDSSGRAVPGAIVTAWSSGPPAWAGDVQSDSTGAFHFPATLAPGEYHAISWDWGPEVTLVPETRDALATRGATATLEESSRANLNLSLISRETVVAEAAKLP